MEDIVPKDESNMMDLVALHKREKFLVQNHLQEALQNEEGLEVLR